MSQVRWSTLANITDHVLNMNSTLQVGRSSGSYIKSAKVVSQTGQKTVRRDATGGIGADVDLTISHQDIGGAIPRRRSLYRVDVHGQSTNGTAVVHSVQVVMDTPQLAGGALLTATNIADILRGIGENNAGADLTAILAGEI